MQGLTQGGTGAPHSQVIPVPDAVRAMRDLMALAHILADPKTLDRNLEVLTNAAALATTKIEAANQANADLTKRELALDERKAAVESELERREATLAAREKQLAADEEKKQRELQTLKAQRENAAVELASAKAEAEAVRDDYRRKLAALHQAG